MTSPLLLTGFLPRQAHAEPQLLLINERRLSYLGHMHAELHSYYAMVHSRWGCYCGVGECRPTRFKAVKKSFQVPEGILIMVNGQYYPVPKGTLHRERDIPEQLLAWEAHVCCLIEPPEPEITCAWINEVTA